MTAGAFFFGRLLRRFVFMASRLGSTMVLPIEGRRSWIDLVGGDDGVVVTIDEPTTAIHILIAGVDPERAEQWVEGLWS